MMMLDMAHNGERGRNSEYALAGPKAKARMLPLSASISGRIRHEMPEVKMSLHLIRSRVQEVIRLLRSSPPAPTVYTSTGLTSSRSSAKHLVFTITSGSDNSHHDKSSSFLSANLERRASSLKKCLTTSAAVMVIRGLWSNSKLTDDEERVKDARIGITTCPRSSSFSRASSIKARVIELVSVATNIACIGKERRHPLAPRSSDKMFRVPTLHFSCDLSPII